MKSSAFTSGRLALVSAAILLFAFQLFYLKADPSHDISTSRGPFTDEGLNTCQARNYVNQGSWGMQECDNLIKSPLYNALLAAEFYLFGSKRVVARTAVLLLFLCGLTALSWRKPFSGILLIATAGLQYHLFQFQHFALVEPLVAICLLGGVLSGARFLQQPHDYKLLNWCILWSFVAFFLKIQYFYALLLPVLFWLFSLRKTRPSSARKMPWPSLLLFLSFGLVFFIFWYWPHREFFALLNAHQGSGRFAPFNIWHRAFESSGELVLWNKHNLGYSISFSLLLLLSIFTFRRAQPPQRSLLLGAWFWLALECHKTLILFSPSRYFISSFLAMGFLMAVSGASLIKLNTSPNRIRRARKWLLLVMLVPLLVQHLVNHRNLWQNRRFEGQKLIDLFEALDFRDKTAAGVWATALIWNPSARVIPVWADFLNADLHPADSSVAIIFTEADEADSGGAFRNRGIRLSEWSNAYESAYYGPYQLQWYFVTPALP